MEEHSAEEKDLPEEGTAAETVADSPIREAEPVQPEASSASGEENAPVSESVEVSHEAVHSDAEEVAPEQAGGPSVDGERPGTSVPANLKSILEAALFAAGEPLSLDQLARLFEEHEMPARATLRQSVAELQGDYADRGVNLVEVASGFRFQVGKPMAPWVGRLWEEKPQRYSRAFLETLALIAYRQPITRAEIEEVRGVSVSSNIVKSLSERGWVRVVGHRDVPGRPAIYATTRQFLDYFGLASLDELPPLSELKDIDKFNEELDLKDPDGEAAGDEGHVPPIPIPAADIEPLII